MFTNILGKNIHYQLIEEQWIKGGRSLIIFLHEGLGSIGQWKAFPEKLCHLMQLPGLVYERIGYGKSDYWDGPISSKFLHFEALVLLPRLIQQLMITNPLIIFGHSDGGTIGLIQSAQPMPNLLGSIIEAPHVMMENHSLAGIQMARNMLLNAEIMRAMNRYQNGRAERLVDDWTAHWLNADLRDWDAKDEIMKLSLPLLLMQGDDDEFGTMEQLYKIQKFAKSEILQLFEIKNCGHIPHLQQQNEVLGKSTQFIQLINK
jgi:pimeloyl-ACP methyl ester carboxylesterase